MEIKLSGGRSNFLKRRLGFGECFVVESVERSGGLMMVWKQEE